MPKACAPHQRPDRSPQLQIIKHPATCGGKDDSRDGPSIYLGSDSIDINKARYGHLVGGLKGAIERSRDIKFITDSPEGVQRALGRGTDDHRPTSREPMSAEELLGALRSDQSLANLGKYSTLRLGLRPEGVAPAGQSG